MVNFKSKKYLVAFVIILFFLSIPIFLTFWLKSEPAKKDTDINRFINDVSATFDNFMFGEYPDYSNIELLEEDQYGRLLIKYKSTYQTNYREIEIFNYVIIQNYEKVNGLHFFFFPVRMYHNFSVIINKYYYSSEIDITDNQLEDLKIKNLWDNLPIENYKYEKSIKIFEAHDDDMGLMYGLNSLAYDYFETYKDAEEIDYTKVMIYIENGNVLLGIKSHKIASPYEEFYYLMTIYNLKNENNERDYLISNTYITSIVSDEDFYAVYDQHITDSELFNCD